MFRVFTTSIVSCQGVVQLGGPDAWYNWGGPAKVGAHMSFLFTGSSLVVKIKLITSVFLDFLLTLICLICNLGCIYKLDLFNFCWKTGTLSIYL